MPALLKQQGLLSRCVLRAMLGWLVTSDPCHGPLTDLVFLPGSQPHLYTAAQNDGFCGCFFQGLRDGRTQLIASAEALHCIGPARSLPNLGHNAEDAAGDFFFSLLSASGWSGALSIVIRAPRLHAHLV